MTLYFISDLAKEFGVTEDAIRRYRRKWKIGTWINGGWVFTQAEVDDIKIKRLISPSTREGRIERSLRKSAPTS